MLTGFHTKRNLQSQSEEEHKLSYELMHTEFVKKVLWNFPLPVLVVLQMAGEEDGGATYGAKWGFTFLLLFGSPCCLLDAKTRVKEGMRHPLTHPSASVLRPPRPYLKMRQTVRLPPIGTGFAKQWNSVCTKQNVKLLHFALSIGLLFERTTLNVKFGKGGHASKRPVSSPLPSWIAEALGEEVFRAYEHTRQEEGREEDDSAKKRTRRSDAPLAQLKEKEKQPSRRSFHNFPLLDAQSNSPPPSSSPGGGLNNDVFLPLPSLVANFKCKPFSFLPYVGLSPLPKKVK